MSQLTGHTLADRYVIEEVIGRGGYAAVYRAKDSRLQRTVAVKVVAVAGADAEGRERARARFHREARVAAQLQHPNVVTIFDFGTDETLGLDFLVMELLGGEDLAGRIARSGPPPMDQSLRILREASEGVAAGHRAGLVHRGVRSGNIFLEERSGTDVFRVLVLDFGIAQIVEDDETTLSPTRGRAPLSPAYAAPEQLREERPLTRAADVYGLGVVGFELLTGVRPFEDADDEQARRVVPSVRSRNAEIPVELAAVIERALAYDPAERYQDAGELVRALGEARAQVGAVQPPISPLLDPGAPTAAENAAGDSDYRARRHPRLPDEAVSAVPTSDGRGDGSRRAPAIALLLVVLLAVGWFAFARGGDEAEERAPRAGSGAAPPAVEETEFAGGLNPELPAAPSPASPEDVTDPSGSVEIPAPSGGATGRAPQGAGVDDGPAGSPTAAALHAQGLRLFGSRDYPGAIERLRQAVASAPANAFYRNDLGWAFFMAGDMPQAGRELEEVIRLDPSREIAYANLGEVRLAEGDTAAAVALYQQFLDRNSDPAREAIAERKLARIR